MGLTISNKLEVQTNLRLANSISNNRNINWGDIQTIYDVETSVSAHGISLKRVWIKTRGGATVFWLKGSFNCNYVYTLYKVIWFPKIRHVIITKAPLRVLCVSIFFLGGGPGVTNWLRPRADIYKAKSQKAKRGGEVKKNSGKFSIFSHLYVFVYLLIKSY